MRSIENAARDLRYAVRGLGRSPGFTAAAVLSLALGIGANTAIFSLFYALMLRMLPVPRPAELVSLYHGPGWGLFSYPVFQDLNRRTDLFTGVAAHRQLSRVGLDTGSALLEPVSTNYFEVMQLRPALGRFFTDEPQDRQSVVLSYDLWLNRLGADPKVLGRSLRVDGKPLTIVGIAPPGFHGEEIERPVGLWAPFKPVNRPDVSMYLLLARRRPDVSRRQVQSAMDVLMAHREAVYENQSGRYQKPYIEVRDGAIGFSLLRDEFAKPLRILMAAVLLVLLATCANIAHLLVARGAARQKEIAVRISLGASRGRLVRQALAESLLLAAAGGAMGIGLAWWGARYLLLFIPAWRAGSLDVNPHPAVLAFAVSISVAAAFLFGLVPALRSSAVDPVAGLRSGAGGGKGRPVLRRLLVTAQVAFSVVLVSLAGLFGHSLAAIRMVDMGVRQQSVITCWPRYPRGWTSAQIGAGWRRLVEEANRLPGVLSASYSSPHVLQVGSWPVNVRVPETGREGKTPIELAGPRYFETLGTPLRAGREFDTGDTARSRKVAVVNETFVREYLGGAANPIGRMLTLPDDDPAPRYIAGVVQDIAHRDIRRKPMAAIYVPYSQLEDMYGTPAIVVRAGGPPAAAISALRRELAAVGFEESDPQTVAQLIDESIFQERMLATLSGFFGGLALLLSAIGLYGVVAYGTAQRAGEIGIRMALGAQRPHLLWLVLRDALLLVALGLSAGMPVALAAGRAVSSVLFGIRSADPLALGLTALVMLGAGIAAAFLPARRAASLEPMQALRRE